MFELGVYRLDQYTESVRSPENWISRKTYRNRISLQLFRTSFPPSAKEVSLFENAMPYVLLSTGIYRTTFRHRFREMDTFVNSLLCRHFDPAGRIDMHDWAASDCLTSCEWAGSLFEIFPQARLTASDLTLFFVEAALASGEAFIMETGGELLQYVKPPFVISLSPPEPKMLIVNRLLAAHARRKFHRLRQLWTLSPEWLSGDDDQDFLQPPFIFRRIPLTHPDAENLRRSCPRFAIRRHSVFEPLPEPCHVIRTMNIYNLSYFSKDRLLEGARAVWRSLFPGGLWIVGRSAELEPTVQNATVFVKRADGFEMLDRYGKGSDIEGLVSTELAGCPG